MGICNCQNRLDEGKTYMEFIDSLKINSLKSEELIKKLKEKYLTVMKEDKKKAALLNDIFPLIDSSVIEYREYSQKYFMKYFEENKKKFYALCLLCDKDSNFKRSFEEITNTNKKEWGKNFSADKIFINKEFLTEIITDYITFTTLNTIPYIQNISGSNSTEKYFSDLFDDNSRKDILNQLLKDFKLEKDNNMVNIDMFFKSEGFKKLINKAEILKMFENYQNKKKS